jgi:hypothetical protein
MTTVFLSLNGSRCYVPAWVFPLRFSWDLLNSVRATFFLMIFSGIICRRVKLSQRILRQVHDWVVYKMGALLGSVGHRVKIHKITPATGKERGDLEVKDYTVLQKPQPQDRPTTVS